MTLFDTVVLKHIGLHWFDTLQSSRDALTVVCNHFSSTEYLVLALSHSTAK